MSSLRRRLSLAVLFGLVSVCLTGCEDWPPWEDDPDPNTGTDTAAVTPSASGGSHETAKDEKDGDKGSVVLPGAPGIAITSVPPRGQRGNASGFVAGVNPADYVVGLYIQVSGRWWIKPYANSTVSIQKSGKWSASMTTGGNDVNASQVVAYLVPKGTSVPSLLGSGSLPSSLAGFPHSQIGR